MRKRSDQLLTLLSVICLMVSISGCSIFISTPRTARIHIQGLDNKHFEYIIPLDDTTAETKLDIRISKNYTLQLDFDWLGDPGRESLIDYSPAADKEMIPPLAPWMSCKYRF